MSREPWTASREAPGVDYRRSCRLEARPWDAEGYRGLGNIAVFR